MQKVPPELKQKLLQVKQDILSEKTYSIEEVAEMIGQGEIQVKIEWSEQPLEGCRNIQRQYESHSGKIRVYKT